MGILDKMKDQAGQLAEKAQQGMAQGQAKVDSMQAKKALDGKLRDLGSAIYCAERQGGPREDVDRLLKEIDAYVADHGPIAAPGAASGTATSTTSSQPSGDFRLEDQ